MTQMTDRLRAMEVFIAVLDEGSFSAAGRRLGLTPSAISRVVDRAEDRLGIRLLTRSTRSLVPTEEGLRFGVMARRILADLERSEEEISEAGQPRGLLRISAAVSHGRLRVVPLLDAFSRLYPGIRIDLTLTDHLDDPAQGTTDVAIRFGHLPDSSLTARKLGEETMVVVAAPSYLDSHGTPRHPDDLRSHQCLLFNFDRTRARWPFMIDGRIVHVDVTGSFLANSGEALGMLAGSGLGIVRVSRFAVEEELRSGALREVLAEYNSNERHPIHALFVGSPTIPARVRALVDFLSDRMGR